MVWPASIACFDQQPANKAGLAGTHVLPVICSGTQSHHQLLASRQRRRNNNLEPGRFVRRLTTAWVPGQCCVAVLLESMHLKYAFSC